MKSFKSIVLVGLALLSTIGLSAQKIEMNPTLETIFARKSVRAYSSQKVSREQLTMLARAGMAAPTAMNKQPWAFILVDDRTILDSLATELPYAKMLTKAPAAIIVCGDSNKAAMDVDSNYWIQDCSAATENILLAVESMGLGAVWTGVAPRMDRMKAVASALNLPQNLKPLNVIVIGYPLKEEQPKDKFDTKNIFWNRFK